MSDREATFAQLLAKWGDMPAGDRKAIERALSVEQRLALDEALATSEEGEACTEINEYRGYTGWLARLMKATADDSASPDTLSLLKPRTRETLHDIHKTMRGECEDEHSSQDIFARIKQAWHRMEMLR